MTQYLGVVVADAPEQGAAKPNASEIYIIDRSGSMSWTLDALAQDVCNQIARIRKGNLFSFGWFSSPGQFNWALKGFKVGAEADKETIKRLIRQNASPLGTTCFSGILDSLAQVVKDLSVFGLPTNLFFLTDGHPVVPDERAEITASLSALDRVAPLLSQAVIVGYGAYYNKRLLIQMAEHVGGQLIHADDKAEMGDAIDAFGGMEGDKRVTVHLPKAATNVVGVNPLDNTVVALIPDTDGAVQVMPGTQVYFVTTNPSQFALRNLFDTGWFAIALGHLQHGDIDLALEVLMTKVGDPDLAQAVSSAWTNAEIGRVEKRIRDAIFNPGVRFKEGRAVGRPIDPNQFCLLDALDLLLADPLAAFYPFSPAFSYKRIGPKAEIDGDFPSFMPLKDTACPINALVWHESRLNLSLSTRVKGTVALTGNPAAFGFAPVYPTWAFRTYTIVKNGSLHTESLPVEVSMGTFHKLLGAGMVVTDKDHDLLADRIMCVLDLSFVPIINRAMSNGKVSALALGRLAWDELVTEAALKVYNGFIKRFTPEDARMMEALTPEQEAYLASNGIGKNGYNVPTKKVETTDVYVTRELVLQFKGYSSLPSLNEVESRLADGKKLTAGGLLMEPALSLVRKQFPTDAAGVSALPWLESVVASHKGALREVRREIQATKFAVLLARRRFVEFTDNADEHILDVDGHELRFKLSERQVEF